jgi:hypothetical protein
MASIAEDARFKYFSRCQPESFFSLGENPNSIAQVLPPEASDSCYDGIRAGQ